MLPHPQTFADTFSYHELVWLPHAVCTRVWLDGWNTAHAQAQRIIVTRLLEGKFERTITGKIERTITLNNGSNSKSQQQIKMKDKVTKLARCSPHNSHHKYRTIQQRGE
jgi:hypothetical protein